MRKVGKLVGEAFLAGEAKRIKNASTDGKVFTLHGNTIAWHNPDKSISFTMAGWPTQTTRDRLNDIHQMAFGDRPFHQNKGEQLYNNSSIDPRMVITMHNLMADAA